MNRRQHLIVASLALMVAAVAGCRHGEDPVVMFDEGRYEAAFEAFRPLADAGDREAQNFIGIQYYLGLGVPRDFVRAAGWFERAALSGNAAAQRNLGVLYLRGLGVAQDYTRAYGWFYESATQGNPVAREFLVFMTDLTTPNQTQQARAWVAQRLRRAGQAAR